MSKYEGTQTEKNLQEAFAGESQARNKYTYFASVAKKEGYEQTHVTGKVMYDKDFNGCPYCGSKKFYICNRCGKVVCYHDQEVVTCPNCGSSSSLQAAENVNLSGSDF